MAKKPNRKFIGIFITSGFIVMVAILLSLLGSKIFGREGDEIVMFFEESLNGLSVGSPVVLKGVKIGEVSKINVIANPETMGFKIPVYAIMQAKDVKAIDKDKDDELLEDLIKRGLRARLVSQSYVTGQLMIELEMLPDTPIKYHNVEDMVEIPTALSPMGELSRGLQELPIAEGVDNFTEFFKGLNQAMPEINKIIADIEKIVTRNKGNSVEVMDNVNKAVVNVSKAAKSMQNFVDYLERHPESLIRGKK